MTPEQRAAQVKAYIEEFERQLLAAELDVVANRRNPQANHEALQQRVDGLKHAIEDVRSEFQSEG